MIIKGPARRRRWSCRSKTRNRPGLYFNFAAFDVQYLQLRPPTGWSKANWSLNLGNLSDDTVINYYTNTIIITSVYQSVPVHHAVFPYMRYRIKAMIDVALFW